MTSKTGWPERMFAGRAVAPPLSRTTLRTSDDQIIDLALDLWHGAPDAADRSVLRRAIAPVLDVGCGPGRHVAALVGSGRAALGIDPSRQALKAARRRGAPVVRTSVFGPVPGAGCWATALLLDGNIGIGGDAIDLLRRVKELVHPDGRLLVELSPPSAGSGRFRAQVEHGGRKGPWFPWARVDVRQIGDVASDAGARLNEVWEVAGRFFADLRLLDRQGSLGELEHLGAAS